jgi:hypothetical protein
VPLLCYPISAQSCPSLERDNSGQLLGSTRVNQDHNLAERPGNDRDISRYWHEWEFDGRERRIILCVETALELRPGCDGFDSRRLDELIEEATHIMRASASPIDSIRIVPER